MSSWLDRAKVLLSYYLGTQDNKYLVTQSGLKLWIVDHEYVPDQKFASVFSGMGKALSSWMGEPKN